MTGAISVLFRSCRAASGGLSTVAPVETVSADDVSVSPRGFPPVVNADAIRRSFPKQWSEYLKLTCKSAYGVQRAFPGIDGKTARAWIKGDHGPTGGFVAAVIQADPSALEILGRME